MSVVVVTVTQPGVTVTPTSDSPRPSSTSSSVSAGVIAGIVIGTLVGGILLITLVWYLFIRYRRHKFTRVANPTHDRISTVEDAPDLQYLPKASSPGTKQFTQRQPLVYPVSWPPLSSTSRAHSPGTPPHSITSKTALRPDVTATLDIPFRESEQPSSGSPRFRLSDIPHVRQPSADDASSQHSQQNLFIYRMLQTRAKASEGASLTHRPSLDVSESSPGVHVDQEQLLVDAERTALRDAETAQRDGETTTPGEEDEWEEVESNESSYSQLSAPVDHSALFSEHTSPQNSTSSLLRRKSSRRHRTPALPTELPPVAEVSDTSLEGRSQSHTISTAANPSLDGQVSHGTPSVVDPPTGFPLLTSGNFGKSSTTSGTPPGSISSTLGWGSSSNGRTSRYPSLAPSSIGQSSRSGPRSDAGTDWHHLPSGLAGLTSLQIGPLLNPHSPVEEQPELPDVSRAPAPAPADTAKRAHLREGTVSSIPEVERRDVVQGGIAHIDVAL